MYNVHLKKSQLLKHIAQFLVFCSLPYSVVTFALSHSYSYFYNRLIIYLSIRLSLDRSLFFFFFCYTLQLFVVPLLRHKCITYSYVLCLCFPLSFSYRQNLIFRGKLTLYNTRQHVCMIYNIYIYIVNLILCLILYSIKYISFLVSLTLGECKTLKSSILPSRGCHSNRSV